MRLHGLLLAAGAGTRMGRPKALVHEGDRSWLRDGVACLRDGGCDEVTVVLGASAAEARLVIEGTNADVVVAEDWAEGMSASLAAGLRSLALTPAEGVLVLLVDLPDVTADVVRRVAAAGADTHTLARATFHGRPGHPVLLGRDHWAAILAATSGDRGARDYLADHETTLVECGDLATGRDVDEVILD